MQRTCLVCKKKFNAKPSLIARGGGKYHSRECKHKAQNTKVKKVCLYCGKVFETHLFKIKKGQGNYHSKKCARLASRKRVEIKCLICGKKKEVWKCRVKFGKGKVCSPECAHKAQTKKVKTKCLWCEKPFTVKLYKLKEGTGRFDSRECQGKWRSKYLVGNKSGAWKGGSIFKKCKVCKEVYTVKQSHSNKSNTCSGKCRGLAQRKRKKIICLECGKPFEKRLSGTKNGRGKLCSRPCSLNWINKNMSKKGGTGIEKKMRKELKSRKISFKEQISFYKPIITIPDFLINDKIIVYCDGRRFHADPKYYKDKDFIWKKRAKDLWKKDKKQKRVLKKMGYKVYRFREDDINKSVSKCVDRIFRKNDLGNYRIAVA